MRGEGKKMAHTRQDDKERTWPEVHVDYCFMGSSKEPNGEEKLLTILGAKERDAGVMMASVVPRKGATGEFAA